MRNLSCCDISDAGGGGSAEANVFCFPLSSLFFQGHFHTEQKQLTLHSPSPFSLSLSFSNKPCVLLHTILCRKITLPLTNSAWKRTQLQKTAGASAEKENCCCRYSVRATICFDCLSSMSLWCSQCLLFVFACVWHKHFFCSSDTSSDKVSELLKRMQLKHDCA